VKVINTNIPVNRMARRLEGNIGKYAVNSSGLTSGGASGNQDMGLLSAASVQEMSLRATLPCMYIYISFELFIFVNFFWCELQGVSCGLSGNHPSCEHGYEHMVSING
jgi:hypothetical protein